MDGVMSLSILLVTIGSNNIGQSSGNSVPDCRGMVKTLVCGMKTITWGAGSCKIPGSTIDYCKLIIGGCGLMIDIINNRCNHLPYS